MIIRGSLAALRRGEILTLRKALFMGEMLSEYPIADIPVIPCLPADNRWKTGACLARMDAEGRLDARTKILVNPRTVRTRAALERVLKHEICHLIQCLEGRWKGEDLTKNHKNHPLEIEAKRFAESR
jgi:hypothetical protein